MQLLIIEDESAHQELIAHALERATRSRFTWDMKDSLAEAGVAVQENSYDLILTDLSLPDSPISQTLPSVLELAGKTPVIVLTSLDDPQTILGMIRNGAKDCISKQVMNSYVLERAITYCIDRERLQAEILDKELQLNAELLFRRLFDKSRVGFIISDPEGVIVKANPAFKEWLGYGDDSLNNTNVLELTHPDSRDLSRSIWEKILQGEMEEARYQNVYVHRNGTPLYGEVILQRIDSKNILASIFDLTEHIKTKKALEVARDKAEVALNSKSALVSMMSHDIRAPITSIVGMADYLAHVEITEAQERQECIGVIRRSGMNTLKIIDDILEVSKLEAGTLTINPEPTDIRKLVENAVEIFWQQVREKGIDLEMSFAHTESRPLFDGSRISQILMNLIGNAVKFTEPNGTIQIRVAQNAESWQFSVKDSGIGISETEQSKLFKPFSQANAEIQKKYGGTGLGLSICKGFCEAMGGSISVKSEHGKGSTFTVELPELVRNHDLRLPESVE